MTRRGVGCKERRLAFRSSKCFENVCAFERRRCSQNVSSLIAVDILTTIIIAAVEEAGTATAAVSVAWRQI